MGKGYQTMNRSDMMVFALIVFLIFIIGVSVSEMESWGHAYSERCRAKGGIAYMGPYQKSRCIRKDSVIDMENQKR